MQETLSADRRFDVAIIGAGASGLTLALALDDAGFAVALIGPTETGGVGRTVAILGDSADFLDGLGVRDGREADFAAMRGLRIVDDVGALWPTRPLEFRASEAGREQFGWNVENGRLVNALSVKISLDRIFRAEAKAVDFEFDGEVATVHLDDATTIRTSLVVAADGRPSPTRKAAGIDARTVEGRQVALTFFVGHSQPHGDFSTEFHTREGPLTFVPLPPTSATVQRSSVVWLMSQTEGRRRLALLDESLAAEAEAYAHGLLGALHIASARGHFPINRHMAERIVGRRLALVGDAAHGLSPIGAQGLNLGLRDVAALVETLKKARNVGRNLGDDEILRAYERNRMPDIRLRALAVDALNRSLLQRFPPIHWARNAGLDFVGAVAPLRRALMRSVLGA